jgi:hypothetical protein
VASDRHLVGCLIPVRAGVVLLERSERSLVCSARRSGTPTERLDGIEIVCVGRAGQRSRRARPELGSSSLTKASRESKTRSFEPDAIIRIPR